MRKNPEWETMTTEWNGEGPTARVMLNRPERLNALSPQTLRDVIEVSHWLDEQSPIRVVVFGGVGRAFSAGFDLNSFSEMGDPVVGREQADLGRQAADALTNTRPLTIAAIQGHCVGGGVVLASACDLRVAADDAQFLIPEVDLGIPLAWGGIPRLVRELGPAITKELVLTCRPFSAQEALALRFLNRVVPADQLTTVVDELAAQLAAKPWFSIRATKTQVNAVVEEIAGVGRNANDADTLLTALNDPESRATSRAYLAARATKR